MILAVIDLRKNNKIIKAMVELYFYIGITQLDTIRAKLRYSCIKIHTEILLKRLTILDQN